MLSAQNSGSLRPTACIRGLAEAEAEASVEDGTEDGSIVGNVHQDPFVDFIEYER